MKTIGNVVPTFKTVCIIVPAFIRDRALLCWIIAKNPDNVKIFGSDSCFERSVKAGEVVPEDTQLVIVRKSITATQLSTDTLARFHSVVVFDYTRKGLFIPNVISDRTDGSYIHVRDHWIRSAWHLYRYAQGMPDFVELACRAEEDPSREPDFAILPPQVQKTRDDDFRRAVRITEVAWMKLRLRNLKSQQVAEIFAEIEKYVNLCPDQLTQYDEMSQYTHAVMDNKSREMVSSPVTRMISGISMPVICGSLFYTEWMHLLTKYGIFCIYHHDDRDPIIHVSVRITRGSLLDIDKVAVALGGVVKEPSRTSINYSFNYIDEPHRFPLP